MARKERASVRTIYEIKIKGTLDERWADRFGGMAFTHEADGTTTLQGMVIDQAALHGILDGIRDLGLPLVSLRQVNPEREKRSEPDE